MITGTDAATPPLVTPRQPKPHYVPRLIILGFFLSVAIWFAFGGYDSFTTPNPRWALPNGDTVEILTNESEYSAGVHFVGDRKAETEHYLWIRFRSPLTDAKRDDGDIRAIIALSCRQADSLGYQMIKVEPAREGYLGLVKYSRGSQTYVIDSGGHCHL